VARNGSRPPHGDGNGLGDLLSSAACAILNNPPGSLGQDVRCGGAGSALVIGVDIGLCGAVALVTSLGELVFVADMPVLNDGPAGRPAVNAPLLSALLRQWNPTEAFVEYVGARPGEAASGAFAFGRSRGVVEGVLGAHGLPVRFLTPPVWKRAVGIKPGRLGAKDAARAEAIRRWPIMAERFAPKGSDGLAEAALIAVAGIMRGGVP